MSKASNWSGTRPAKVSATLNHAGDSVENPIVAGLTHVITLYKHSPSEQLKHVWILSPRGARYLDDIAVVSDFDIKVTTQSGRESEAGTPPVKNSIHFTTTYGHYWCDFYVASLPPVCVTLDGYNASDSDEPIIVPFA